VGYYTVLASKLIGRRGRVWAIESNPGWVDIVRQIIALNGLDNADVIHTALSDRSEPLRSIRQEVSTELTGGGVTVQAETCDAMCQRLGLRPNVAKMDVHGFEGKVLRGMREIMNTTLEYVLLELHNAEFLHRFTPDISRIDVLDYLDAAGFKSYHVAGHGYGESEARLIVDTGKYAYYPLTRENRDVLMFDRHSKVFVLAAKQPIEDVIGPSIIDPGLLAIASPGHSAPSRHADASDRERRAERVAAAALD
jgi:FkbM family methyltransferase